MSLGIHDPQTQSSIGCDINIIEPLEGSGKVAGARGMASRGTKSIREYNGFCLNPQIQARDGREKTDSPEDNPSSP